MNDGDSDYKTIGAVVTCGLCRREFPEFSRAWGTVELVGRAGEECVLT